MSEIWKKLKVPNVLRCKIRKYPFRVSCPPSVCPVITIRMLGAYAPYARYLGGVFVQRLESSWAPSPCIADEQSSEAKKVKPVKGEKIDRKDILKNENIHQKKDATSFFETCTSFRCNLLHLFLRDTTSFFERCYVFLKKMLRLFKQTGGTDVYGFGLTLSQLIFCDY